MSGPFHYDARWYTSGEGVDDEGTAPCVGSDQFPLFGDFVDSLMTFICGDSDLFIYFSHFAQLLEISVHCLIGIEWEYQVVSLVWYGSILLNDRSHHVVNLNLDAVSCLDRCDFDVIILDVIPLQRGCIGVS